MALLLWPVAVSRFFWSVTQRWSRYGAAEIRILDERDAWSDDVAIQGSDFMDVDLFACRDTPRDDALDGAILATIGAVTEAVSATVRTWSVSVAFHTWPIPLSPMRAATT